MRLAASLKSGAALTLAAALLLSFGDMPSFGQPNAPGIYQEVTPGLLSRTVFKTEVGDTTVEIIDLLVGPGRSSEPITLAGGAVLDVQAGSAALLINGKPQRVEAGKVVALATNQRIAIDNRRAPRPFVARLVLLSRSGG